jgi:hypothetical protein
MIAGKAAKPQARNRRAAGLLLRQGGGLSRRFADSPTSAINCNPGVALMARCRVAKPVLRCRAGHLLTQELDRDRRALPACRW